jgi:hypothetical protein
VPALPFIRKQAVALALAFVWVGASGCDSEPSGTLPDIQDIITRIATADGSVVGVLRQGGRPTAGGGPSVTVDATPTAINGGSFQVEAVGSAPFARVVVSVQGLEGYYELTFPAPVASADLIASVSRQARPSVSTFLFGAAAQGGGLGAPASSAVRIIRVATGDVQASVWWDAPTDVDLHVIDPAQEEVYFANRESASGGVLDLDSNPACNIDGINNENIVWPTGGAPTGSYTINLVYFDDCGEAESNYVVTLQVVGQAPRVFTGTFTGVGNPSLDRLITQFTR